MTQPSPTFEGAPDLILASQSPRRRQLLADAGYQFRVELPRESAECGICSRETPPELVARLAWQKAQDVAQRVESGMIVACDTIAECMGQVLGKPHDREHAREMLLLLRGRHHHVYSGVCLWRQPDGIKQLRVAATELVMDPLTDQQLESYLDSEQWQGKAGAFGYQDGLDWVHIVSGSESNVVGLPMELLAEMLADFPQHDA
ncbi:MAG: septum formation protein Maf [Planctomycetales bacterium]|nr:septum formation protein Maf [Planctomycetales bacterium]